MGNSSQKHEVENNLPRRVVVWDLPTRVFHWLLVIFVAISFVTGNIGGNAMQYHEWSGVVICVLLIFRFAWGFAGGRQSRFITFVRSPAEVSRYATGLLKRHSARFLGHNPLGGWSILAMLLALSVQVGTGLFANDDILTEGPLYHLVMKETSDWLTRMHLLNRLVIAALVAIHVFAVFFYLFVKRENLLTPMITGIKNWHSSAESSSGSILSAVVIGGLAALAVYFIVY